MPGSSAVTAAIRVATAARPSSDDVPREIPARAGVLVTIPVCGSREPGAVSASVEAPDPLDVALPREPQGVSEPYCKRPDMSRTVHGRARQCRWVERWP